jgi:hypothetical protein
MPQQLKHTMYEFEVTPPPAAWEAIAARLNDDAQYALISSKMTEYKVTPPPDCWNNVAASLNEVKTNNTKVPVIKISRKFYRYTAAAIIIGLIAGVGWLFINNSPIVNIHVAGNAGKQPFETTAPEQNKTAIESSQEQNNNGVIKAKEQQVYIANKNNPHFTYQSNDNIQSHILKYAIVNAPLSRNEGLIIISSPPILDEKGAVIRDMEVLTTNNNYLIVAGPDGQLTRISSKFANVIRYLNSGDNVEEYLDKVIRESGTWKKRFQEWRNKISQSTFIPSSANFLDIMEFKELIDEKQ